MGSPHVSYVWLVSLSLTSSGCVPMVAGVLPSFLRLNSDLLCGRTPLCLSIPPALRAEWWCQAFTGRLFACVGHLPSQLLSLLEARGTWADLQSVEGARAGSPVRSALRAETPPAPEFFVLQTALIWVGLGLLGDEGGWWAMSALILMIDEVLGPTSLWRTLGRLLHPQGGDPRPCAWRWR